MPEFKVVSPFEPSGDQPEAIDAIANGIELGLDEQTLQGVTGSGKTFTMAKVIERVQRPTLVLAHNKTLAAQLCAEFKEFFPNNAVEYFVSYYDYYQPEAYIPHTDTFIEKDASINEEIDRLRHSATSALFERRDVIVVSSVSCIYGLGNPIDYKNMVISLRTGMEYDRNALLKKLIEIRYERNDIAFDRNMFRVRGDTVEIYPVYAKEHAIRVEFWGDEVDRISEINVVTGAPVRILNHVAIYPASHYVTTKDKLARALAEIEAEMWKQVEFFQSQGKAIEAPRPELSKYAPKMIRTIIDEDKIREVIGPGGKVIQRIVAETGCKIDIEDDGSVFIAAADADAGARALAMIEAIAKDPEIGSVFTGRVTRIMNFGAFVEIAPGKEGLVHISKLDHKRVEKVEDVVSVGDEIKVKVIEIDEKGRINLSRKDCLPKPAPAQGSGTK